MHFAGAVDATKALRSRDKPIAERVELARGILDETIDLMLPRRNLVLLEWAFDMLATDASARESALVWDLLAEIWQRAEDHGRLRLYRNHKYPVDLAVALKAARSAEFVDAVKRATDAIALSTDLLSYSTDAQAKQLVLSYLSNEFARNASFGELIFHAIRNRTHIFGAKEESWTLDALLLEPDQTRRLHYLRDFLSESSVSPVASSELHIEDIMQSVCDSHVEIQKRFNELTLSFPEWAGPLLEVLLALTPREASPELLEKLVTSSLNSVNGEPDWKVMELVLHVNAAPVLQYMNTLLEASPTDHVLALLITRSAALRSLPDFLSHWVPKGTLSSVVKLSLSKAVDSLAPGQLTPFLNSESPLLELLLTAISYKAAASPQIRLALQALFSSDISPSIRLLILDLVPSLDAMMPKKSKDVHLSLRVSEISGTSTDLKPILKQVKSDIDASEALLRFYPLLCVEGGEKYLQKLFRLCSHDFLSFFASREEIYEFKSLTDAFIEILIDANEFEALDHVPKSVLAWNQRHRIVDAALQRGGSGVGGLVVKLIDSANPPELKDLSRLLHQLQPDDAKLLTRIVRPLLKYHDYIGGLKNLMKDEQWQLYCLMALSRDKLPEVLAWVGKVYTHSSLLSPVLEVLSMLPFTPDSSRYVEALTLQLSPRIPESLFKLLCLQSYHWSVITALFSYSQCLHIADFAAYCRRLEQSELDCLIMAAADEDLHGVLRALSGERLMQNKFHSKAVSAVIAKCCYGTVEVSHDFLELCSAILRENTALLVGSDIDMLIAIIAALGSTSGFWGALNTLLSNVVLLQRRRLRGRMHLVIGAMTSLLQGVNGMERAKAFARLIDNLCNPAQQYLGGAASKEELNSAVARDRRYVSRTLGVLLQNYVFFVLSGEKSSADFTEIHKALRPAAFTMMDTLGGDEVRSVAAGLDFASRMYLRALYEDYAQNARWKSD